MRNLAECAIFIDACSLLIGQEAQTKKVTKLNVIQSTNPACKIEKTLVQELFLNLSKKINVTLAFPDLESLWLHTSYVKSV